MGAAQLAASCGRANGGAGAVWARGMVWAWPPRVVPGPKIQRRPAPARAQQRQRAARPLHLPQCGPFLDRSIGWVDLEIGLVTLPCAEAADASIENLSRWSCARSILHDHELCELCAGENGGRADTRWVALSDESGAGIVAVTLCKPLQINASRCAGSCTALAHCLCRS